MKKYYELEQIDLEKSEEDKETIVEKHYSIYIEGMQYGTICRKTHDYSEALRIYREMKNKFNVFKCYVVLDRYTVYKNGVTSVKNVYRKAIGQKYDLQTRFNQILEIINDIDRMKRMYTNTHSEADKYLSAFTHIIEESNTEDLTDEEIRAMLRGVEETAALRRISKVQMDYIQNITQNLGSIRSNTNKCIETCKKLEYLNNTDKAKQNSKAKSEEYRRVLGLALKEV